MCFISMYINKKYKYISCFRPYPKIIALVYFLPLQTEDMT